MSRHTELDVSKAAIMLAAEMHGMVSGQHAQAVLTALQEAEQRAELWERDARHWLNAYEDLKAACDA